MMRATIMVRIVWGEPYEDVPLEDVPTYTTYSLGDGPFSLESIQQWVNRQQHRMQANVKHVFIETSFYDEEFERRDEEATMRDASWYTQKG